MQKRGTKSVTWQVDKDACELCQDNEGQTVELGQEFASGHILPPAHPYCECTVKEHKDDAKNQNSATEIYFPQRPSGLPSSVLTAVRTSEQGNAREDYQSFRSALNA